ncbi:MAG: serine/threonine-protein kinase [Polyangiaceae bacterium]
MPRLEELPRQFGKYTLLRKLAAGGMAEIFLALHRSMAGFEKLVVIKRILPSMNSDRAFIDMLLHEARIAATLSHPNIVQIFDVGQVDGTFFIAMEHIHGEDIRSIVRGMRRKGVAEVPLEHALAIALGVCAGLAYAHDKRDLDGRVLGIVHRDISPQNIVVTFTGDVKIVDFGIAKSEQVEEDVSGGQLKGKVPYMSPEQAAGKALDLRSDIFAVGVVLFELTTNKRLFKGDSEHETLRLIIDSEYPLPSMIRPTYPRALERIVMKALAKRVEDRYQTAREMQADLEAFVREERIAVSTVSLTQWMQMLFEDKLAQQSEALQDIKQLADVIAAQQKDWDPTATITGTGTGAGTLTAPLITQTIVEPPRRSNAPLVAGVSMAVLLAAGAFFFLSGPRVADPSAEPLASAATTGAPEVKRGFVDVVTDPPGCAIWINGDLRPEVSPAKVEQLPFGAEIQLKLTSEGLEAYRDTFTLTADAPSKKVDVKMRAGSVTVVLKVDPPPTIWLDGKPWQGDRAKLENLSADEEHKLVLSATGFLPKTVTFSAKAGETKTIEEHLVREGAAGSAPAGGGTSTGGAAAPTAASGGTGKVRVNSKGGFCTVSINGAGAGATPTEAVVPAGNVRISCKPPSGPAQTQFVKVGPGETARVSFKLD